MDLFVAFDGDHIGRMIGRMSLADDVEGIRRISQAIEHGNDIWRSWCLTTLGEVIEIGGDEGRLKVPAEKIGELEQIRKQYQGAVDSTVSVGVGTKLSEADRALMAAKLQGGDRIVLYTPEVEDIIEESQKQEQTEAQKLGEEYLGKAEHPLRAAAFRHKDSGDVVETGAFHDIGPWLKGGAASHYPTSPGTSSDWDSGFVTQEGAFLNREQAAQHVAMAPRIHPITGKDRIELDSADPESGLGTEGFKLGKGEPGAPILTPPPPPPPATGPSLHSTVEGFMTGLKLHPKGSAARGKFITQHMNHGPFLSALKVHPQGAQVHQMLTQHMNSQANAGFRPGLTVATAKSEVEELKQLLKADPPPPPSPVEAPDQPAENSPAAGGGFAGHQQPSADAAPVAPVAEASEHSQGEAAQAQADEQSSPESTHSSHEEQLHGHAQQEAARDEQGTDLEDLKGAVVKILQQVRGQAPLLEQLQQTKPELFAAVNGSIQAMLAMAHQLLDGDDSPEEEKNHGEESKPGEEQPARKSELSDTSDKDPVNAADIGQCQHFYGKGSKKCLRCKVEKAEPPEWRDCNEDDGASHWWVKDYAGEYCGGCLGDRGIIEGSLQKSERNCKGKHFYGHKGHHKCIRCGSLKAADAFAKDEVKPNLEKAKLPMPSAPTEHHLKLPVGSVKGQEGKMKVQHSDGKTTWAQMRAGMVLSNDGHPISSRNAGGK